jgi:hypothetical protein
VTVYGGDEIKRFDFGCIFSVFSLSEVSDSVHSGFWSAGFERLGVFELEFN